MKKITLILTLVFFTAVGAFAQLEDPISWAYKATRISKTEVLVSFKATIEDGWHLYSQNVKPGGPNKTTFTFAKSKDYTQVGTTTEPKPIVKYEKVFKMDIGYFQDEALFTQKIKLNKNTTIIKATVNFQLCNDTSCLPPKDVSFSIPVK